MNSPALPSWLYDGSPIVPRWACCGGACSDTHTVTCPVLSKDEPFIAAMLEGIGRALAKWSEV